MTCVCVRWPHHCQYVNVGEQVCGVKGEQCAGHADEDEVVEGDVDGRLTTPVRRRQQARDP